MRIKPAVRNAELNKGKSTGWRVINIQIMAEALFVEGILLAGGNGDERKES